jgi:hypothetical protein
MPWEKVTFTIEDVKSGKYSDFLWNVVTHIDAMKVHEGIVVFSHRDPSKPGTEHFYCSPKASDEMGKVVNKYKPLKCKEPPVYFDHRDPFSHISFVVGDKNYKLKG